MLEQDGATRATRGGMNMLPHCVQTSVVDLGPRCSGLLPEGTYLLVSARIILENSMVTKT